MMGLVSDDSKKSILHSSLRFLSGTLISRLSGFVRDVLLAKTFGVHPSLAALMTAFRLSHMMRRILGEGALHSVFVPKFEALKAENPEDALCFFRDLFFHLLLVLLLVVGIGELVLGGLLHSSLLSTASLELASLISITLPSLVFIVIFSLIAAFLQCEGAFFLPGIAPLAFNLVWIGALLLLSGRGSPYDLMPWMALAIGIACFCQAFIAAMGLWRRISWQILAKAPFFPPNIRQLTYPLALGISGVAATQINSSLDYLFARAADLSGPAYLWYAMRIQQLPLALVGVSLANALLPSLSRAAKAGDMPKFRRLFSYVIRCLVAFLLPCTLAVFLFGVTFVQWIYGRGEFDQAAVLQTTYCLRAYGAGLVPMGLVMTIAPAYYALGDYKTPAKATLWAVSVGVLLNIFCIYIWKMGPVSVAAATSISAVLNCAILITSYGRGTRKPWEC